MRRKQPVPCCGAPASARYYRRRSWLPGPEFTQSVISAYESGHRQPALTTLAALIDAAGDELIVNVRRRPRRLGRLSGPVGRRVRRRRRELVEAAAARGVTNLRVFGSAARGQDRADSDVDLLADLPPGMGLLGLGRGAGRAGVHPRQPGRPSAWPPISNPGSVRGLRLTWSRYDLPGTAAAGRYPGRDRRDPLPPAARRPVRRPGLRCGPDPPAGNRRSCQGPARRAARLPASHPVAPDHPHAPTTWPTATSTPPTRSCRPPSTTTCPNSNAAVQALAKALPDEDQPDEIHRSKNHQRIRRPKLDAEARASAFVEVCRATSAAGVQNSVGREPAGAQLTTICGSLALAVADGLRIVARRRWPSLIGTPIADARRPASVR